MLLLFTLFLMILFLLPLFAFYRMVVHLTLLLLQHRHFLVELVMRPLLLLHIRVPCSVPLIIITIVSIHCRLATTSPLGLILFLLLYDAVVFSSCGTRS